jgi:hypothetical protein
MSRSRRLNKFELSDTQKKPAEAGFFIDSILGNVERVQPIPFRTNKVQFWG